MTNIYFTYRHQTDRYGNIYTPYHILQKAYPEWQGFVTLQVEKITVNKDTNGRPVTGEYLGWVEVDDTNVSVTKVEDELKGKGVGELMTHLINDDAVTYMRNNCSNNHPETSTDRKFKLKDVLDADGNIVDTKYLTIS